jgi:hypothetical protein
MALASASTARLVELDDRRRVQLAKIGHRGHRRYLATVADDGTITLVPAVVLTEREAAVLADPELVAAITAGVQEAHQGKTSPVDWSLFD